MVPTVRRDDSLTSLHLQRPVRLEVVLPPGYDAAASAPYPVLCLNDGQDLWRLRLPATLRELYRRGELRPFVLVAVHAHERIQEYGTASQPDYMGRGSRAGHYAYFIREELLPHVQQHYHVSADPEQVVWAGCSLGGLAAFDFVWHNPGVARRAGAFSPSFWWRRRALDDGYTDADRIMHGLVRATQPHPQHQFWLQTGTLDETNDRNQNGIIDSIEDTLDLMALLARQGLPEAAVRYAEVVGGRHNQLTWARLLPDFLRWAFGAAGTALGPPPNELPATSPAGSWSSRLRRAGRRKLLPSQAAAPATSPAPPSAMNHLTTRPGAAEYAPYYDTYIRLIPEGHNPLQQLQEQPTVLKQLLQGLTDEQARLRYAPGKWSIKESLVHVLDTERIFAYRALRIARGDTTPLPGFEQNDYVPASGADERSLADILREYDAVRAATLSFFSSLRPEDYERTGTASTFPVSVRALAYMVPGHEAHHLRLLTERYLPLLE
ncbi:alpha/beta hydrolase-fold protein [Hymenobacter sp. HSC-4F20]|uniref:alpha/beta hydrolase-fold protein n=1 Tax=Hymenobacter sp. HSC-4F20 TaxID=2864135 RepID=UPI002175C84F|nr:alpha/beta hydrolase-fold protein [Hymenobacter sp. HSC-4F20]